MHPLRARLVAIRARDRGFAQGRLHGHHHRRARHRARRQARPGHRSCHRRCDAPSFTTALAEARSLGRPLHGRLEADDEDQFEEFFPGKWDEALSSIDDTGETEFDLDRSYLWSQGRSRLRLVEHWYRADGEWRFAFYAGTELLRAGISPFFDEKGKTVSRYDAFAVHIDEAGEHYGFVRNLIGPQDAMNQHRSKSVHIMNTRQLKVNRRAIGGDQPDIETARREAARPDGVMLYDGDPNDVEVLEGQQEFIRQTQYYQDAKDEIEQFGPNPQLIGAQPSDQSGRAFAMAQQSGIAELGPFLSQWRAWKLRLYRKIRVAQQRHWTAERTLRVTNDQGAARYMTLNAVAADPWGARCS